MKSYYSISSRQLRTLVLSSLFFASCISAGFAQNKFPIGAYVNGMFTITFLADGNHNVSAEGNVLVKGSYVVSGDQLVLTDKEGEYACGADQPGKYKWTVEGTSLKFEKVEDACEGRAAALAGQLWTKK